MQQMVRTGAPSTPTIEDLYTQYRPSLVSYFSSHGFTHEDAEDLTQDTFFKAWQALSKVQYDNLRPWLYRIAKNVAIDAARKQHMRECNAPQCPLEEEWCAGMCNQEETILTRLSLVEALQRIPERYRRAVVFSAYGFSLAEIAALASYSPKAINTIVHRGRKALKQCYQEV
ncbi:MAG: RNA polymerase sigma factor [Ktedonobacteraceae bacterium]|nr:RNA polymerase sigma factor [Ktedonobacteraceae bacterium]